MGKPETILRIKIHKDIDRYSLNQSQQKKL